MNPNNFRIETEESQNQLKTLKDKCWAANQKFKDQNTIAGSHRLWATTWPENFKEENMKDAIEQLSLVDNSFRELQKASLDLYKYLLDVNSKTE